MYALHPLHLTFLNTLTEKTFRSYSAPRVLLQGRFAIMIGLFVYLLIGILDLWFVPIERQADIWAIRLTTGCEPLVLFAITYTRWFERWSQQLLAFNCLVAGIGFIAMIRLLPPDVILYYYPSLILLTFYTYNFVGTRFIYAALVDVFLVITYNLVMAPTNLPIHELATQDLFILSANLIGGSAGYLAEYYRRKLFIQQKELEHERESNLNRALHDSLTGLANRELLFDRITHALTNRHLVTHAAMFVDLDGFKNINDQFGHSVGDTILVEVAHCLKSVSRASDTVARLGGDEFFLVVSDIANPDDAMARAQRVLDALSLPCVKDSNTFSLSASIGVCIFPSEQTTASHIISCADHAMYQAKLAGKNQAILWEG